MADYTNIVDMFRDIMDHEHKVEIFDDPISRKLGFKCIVTDNVWQIKLTDLKSSLYKIQSDYNYLQTFPSRWYETVENKQKLLEEFNKDKK